MKMEMPDPDLTKCPNCGGVADNGHDRCIPPNPYYCTRCEENEALKAENEELKVKLEKFKWKSIDTAPKDGTHILVGRSDILQDDYSINRGYVEIAGWIASENCWFCLDGIDVANPTHWMSLPQQPKEILK